MGGRTGCKSGGWGRKPAPCVRGRRMRNSSRTTIDSQLLAVCHLGLGYTPRACAYTEGPRGEGTERRERREDTMAAVDWRWRGGLEEYSRWSPWTHLHRAHHCKLQATRRCYQYGTLPNPLPYRARRSETLSPSLRSLRSPRGWVHTSPTPCLPRLPRLHFVTHPGLYTLLALRPRPPSPHPSSPSQAHCSATRVESPWGCTVPERRDGAGRGG
ncbi:hypothetical protein DFH06DRAFT_601769 [Mycena polygramma]|nr:hypothetical protein DFH06DRAFT_601769 [Mycena polygramma]